MTAAVNVASLGTAVNADSSGNVGIGTTTINNAITTYRGAGVNNYIQFTNSTTGTASTDGCLIGVAADDTSLRLRVLEAASMIFTTSDTERARIDSNGNFGVNEASPGAYGKFTLKFDATAGANNLTGFAVFPTAATSGARFFQIYNEAGSGIGSITRNGTTNAVLYNTSSDYRLKENVEPLTNALTRVAQLRPVKWKWKGNTATGEGFIAHELQIVVPSAVSGEKDAVEIYTDTEGMEQTRPAYQGLDASYLVATLTAAIQEQQALITQQAAAITALTTRITALEAP